MSDEPDSGNFGPFGSFEKIMKEIMYTIVGFIGGFGSVVLFISVYPVMPFLAIISFTIAFLKYFFHRVRKL